MTGFGLAVGIPLVAVAAFLVSARWWMPRMSGRIERAGTVLVLVPWGWAVLSAAWLGDAAVRLITGHTGTSTYTDLAFGVGYALLALASSRFVHLQARRRATADRLDPSGPDRPGIS